MGRGYTEPQIKVGKGIPEFTPVESATTAELSKGGLRVVTL